MMGELDEGYGGGREMDALRVLERSLGLSIAFTSTWVDNGTALGYKTLCYPALLLSILLSTRRSHYSTLTDTGRSISDKLCVSRPHFSFSRPSLSSRSWLE